MYHTFEMSCDIHTYPLAQPRFSLYSTLNYIVANKDDRLLLPSNRQVDATTRTCISLSDWNQNNIVHTKHTRTHRIPVQNAKALATEQDDLTQIPCTGAAKLN